MEYFAKQENFKALETEIQSWLGMPYLHMGYTKGGVDCTKFVGVVCLNLGILKTLDCKEYYSKDWYIHGKKDNVLNFLKRYSEFLRAGLVLERLKYSGQDLLPGDLLGLSFCTTGICNHVAIFLGDGKLVHCIERKGVLIADLLQWEKLIKYVFRLYEV